MKKSTKIVVCVVFSFLFCFLCIGYANLNDSLYAEGDVDIARQNGVYIFDVKVLNDANATANHYIGTVLNSTVTLPASADASVTMEITVYNNSSEAYGYNVMKYAVGESTYDNENIHISTTIQKQHPDWKLEPQAYMTFPITFSYAEGADLTKNTLNSIVDFEFLPFEEIPENEDQTTVQNAMDRFGEILNSPTEYQTLTDQLDNSWASGRFWDTSYTSNVAGAHTNDKSVLDTLFAGNLNININGNNSEVKILIKRENVNNSYAGDEMTIYMTTDPLDTRGATAIVYRCIFVNENGTWKQLNDMVEGTAPVTNYNGFSGTGSFNTDRWSAK